MGLTNYALSIKMTWKRVRLSCIFHLNVCCNSYLDEKLFTAFKWHMSGINVYASTDIGRHISTLVRTLTIIGSDLEEADSEVYVNLLIICSDSFKCSLSAPGESKPLHKRAFSVSSKTFVDEQETLRAMEWDLARQTRKLNKMR